MWESKVAPLSGVLFSVLLVAQFSIAGSTEFMPPEGDVVAHLEGGPVRIWTAAYLGLLAAAALVWFSGSVYKALRRVDDDDGRLSALALAGGVFASVVLAVAGGTTIAAADRVRIVGSIEPGVAASLLDFAGIALGGLATIGMAVLIAAHAVASLRTEGGRRWIGWVGIVIALGLLSPISYAVLGAAVLWVPVVGVVLYRLESARLSMAAA